MRVNMTVRQNIPFGCTSNSRTQPARRAPNGGSARTYLADLSGRQRSGDHGHPRRDSEHALDIYADHRIPATRAHAADKSLRGSLPVGT
jgi:hypothetical protein